MTLHLKDRELEQKLIELCPDFVNKLNDAYSPFGFPKEKIVAFTRKDPDGSLRSNILRFWKDELEEVDEYIPDDWNEYPDITPPENVLMRIESVDDSNNVYHECGIFRNGLWYSEINGTVRYALDAEVLRFRPWE